MATALLASLTASCGDEAPFGIPEPCIGKCVASVDVDLEDLIRTPGDTVRLRADAESADGTRSLIRWTASSNVVAVDSPGFVTALVPGRTVVVARPSADTAKTGIAEIWVVDPDTGGQPFLTGFRDARTGSNLPRLRGFAGHDSIAITVSYVLGNSTSTPAQPYVDFQIRRPGSAIVVRSTTLPLIVRGRGAFINVTLHLTERDSRGQRLLPTGAYDLFVLLPLANGRILGEETGYRITF